MNSFKEKNKDDTLCENISDYHPVDEFICSKCGLIMRDLQRYEIDEDTNGQLPRTFKCVA